MNVPIESEGHVYRNFLKTNPNPNPKLDYVTELCKQFSTTLRVTLTYVPDKLLRYLADKESSKRCLLFLSLVGCKRDLIKLDLGLTLFLQIGPMILLILRDFVFFQFLEGLHDGLPRLFDNFMGF